MLKNLLKAWRAKGMTDEMFKEFTKMLADAKWMFCEACEAVFQKDTDAEARSSLFGKDIKINKAERHIRKQIVEHFAIRPGEDVSDCLILMSVVKDAERIGDYCTNLYDTRTIMGAALPEDDFRSRLFAAHEAILGVFKKVSKGFSEGDEKIAYKIISGELKTGKELDSIVLALAESDLSTRHAVCLTLIARHMKRINAHLGNIASTVVMPLHKIDYFDEKIK